ncbi:MAG: IS91 family transposase [Hungatella sp.]
MMSDATAFYRSLSEVATGSYPIRDAFQAFFPEYASSHSISQEQSKAARCISECKTGSLGYNISFCESCGHMEIHACSCNNRNCPCCQSPQEQKWIMARNSELIEKCAYYHSIFTVPFELNNLIYENQKSLYHLMFSCASDTLLTLCRDKKHMGATPGIILVLHTWGQQLNFHPHLHCCLSGGGLTESGQFTESCHKGFLLPVEAIGKMFRGKFLEKLNSYYKKDALAFTGKCTKLRNHYNWKEFINSLYSKDWCPFIKETFNGNGNAITYLARYAYRTAISNNRIESVSEDSVSFRYKDYADHQASKIKTVSGTEFIALFLQHILPKGFSRVRFSGFLSNCCKTKKLKLIHKLRGTVFIPNPVKGKSMAELLMLLYKKDIDTCPECKGHVIRFPRGKPLSLPIINCSLT